MSSELSYLKQLVQTKKSIEDRLDKLTQKQREDILVEVEDEIELLSAVRSNIIPPIGECGQSK